MCFWVAVLKNGEYALSKHFRLWRDASSLRVNSAKKKPSFRLSVAQQSNYFKKNHWSVNQNTFISACGAIHKFQNFSQTKASSFYPFWVLLVHWPSKGNNRWENKLALIYRTGLEVLETKPVAKQLHSYVWQSSITKTNLIFLKIPVCYKEGKS